MIQIADNELVLGEHFLDLAQTLPERTFLMRNFTTSEKYYRELDDRLLKRLSSLEPSEAQEQIELDEELVLAPFGLGHSLIYLHRYSEALQAIENGLKIYPDWANNHASLLFFQDPLFTGPVLTDLERQMRSTRDQAPWLLHGYIHFFSDNFREASKSFSQVLSSDKGNFLANYFIQHMELAQRQNPVARLESFNEKETDKLPVDEVGLDDFDAVDRADPHAKQGVLEKEGKNEDGAPQAKRASQHGQQRGIAEK